MYDWLTKFLGSVVSVFDAVSVEALVLRVLGAALVLLVAFWVSRAVQRYLVRRLQGHDTGDEQTIHLYRQVVQSVVWVIGGGIALHTLGIDLTHLLTTSGLFAVALASDLRKVRATLETVCEGLDWKSARKQPLVQLLDFGDSSVIFRVLVWIEAPWVAGRLRSELNEAIWWALKDAGVVIAFPQLDVHIAQGCLSDASR